MRIIWEGGAVTDHELTLPKAGSHAATDQDTIELVRRLAIEYPDHQIAGILARQGRVTGAGKPFTAHRVRSLRNHHKIPPRHSAPRRPQALRESPSPRPPQSSAYRPRPCTAGCAKGSSSASR